MILLYQPIHLAIVSLFISPHQAPLSVNDSGNILYSLRLAVLVYFHDSAS
jgi:hypothetical protein